MARHIFLIGEKNVGKSTLIMRYLEEFPHRTGGFRTIRTDQVFAGKRSVHLVRTTEKGPNYENLLFFCSEKSPPAIKERLEYLGCNALRDSDGFEILLMDELGAFVDHAPAFQQAVISALDGNIPILGVMERGGSPFLERISRHPNVDIVEVTAENRNAIASRKLRHEDQTNSFGAIVIEESTQEPMVLLIEGQRGCSFPKGRTEPGETPEQTAVRETFEETGIRITVDSRFRVVVPSAKPGDIRTVTFFYGKSLDGLKEPIPAEVSYAAWVPLSQAADRVQYPPDRNALIQAAEYRKSKSDTILINV